MSKQIIIKEYRHSGGTKNYHVIQLIDDKTGGLSSRIIRRWGKVGAIGQFKIGDFETVSSVRAAANKEEANRVKKGYSLEREMTVYDFDHWIKGGHHRNELKDTSWLAHKEAAQILSDWTRGSAYIAETARSARADR